MIYFISTNDVADYPIKMRLTGREFRQRIAPLQTACPYRLEPIAVIEGGRSIEQVLHDEFAADKLEGEWYRRTPRLLNTIDLLENSTMKADALRGCKQRRAGRRPREKQLRWPIQSKLFDWRKAELRAD